MFTGIIQAQGRIEQIDAAEDTRLLVDVAQLDIAAVALGDSIAVNGVCLTVVEKLGNAFWTDVSNETLRLTTLGALAAGEQVNLETALTPQTALGGHWVSGHVDGVGEVVDMQKEARSTRFELQVPDQLARYVAVKGSIAIDGTSITVNTVDHSRFSVNIIPHTMSNTRFGHYQVGTRVNIEVDVIARYVERLASFSGTGIDT